MSRPAAWKVEPPVPRRLFLLAVLTIPFAVAPAAEPAVTVSVRFAVFAPQLRRLDLGRRLVEGPGVQPLATTAAGGANIAAAEVDPGLAPAVEVAERRDG